MFVTSEGRPGARLQRALAARNLTAAEQAAFEIAFVSLAQARELVELYAEKGDPKYDARRSSTSRATWPKGTRRWPTSLRSPRFSRSAAC